MTGTGSGYVLLDVLDELGGVGGDGYDEITGAGVDKGAEAFDVLAAADELEDEAAVLAELGAVGEEGEGAVPADDLASEGDDGSAGVDGALLLEELEGVLGGVEDDVGLAEEGDGDDVACGRYAGVSARIADGSNGSGGEWDEGLTPALAPLGKGAPFVAGGHVEHVADDGEALGPWGEGPGGLLCEEAVQKNGSHQDGNGVEEGW